ncbi:hypothetical protein DERP_014105 [Dermatophagoides pteronyssinus]|uniref:Uncharacterized protein n=1 Tax=Dermatophagoides pteronyssinus TaxID=6956 RepID=A0ABQ8J6I1_DERPT|nr:hypothetical protein DERP_014105 [Dermatophagoides pteronyssinus]
MNIGIPTNQPTNINRNETKKPPPPPPSIKSSTNQPSSSTTTTTTQLIMMMMMTIKQQRITIDNNDSVKQNKTKLIQVQFIYAVSPNC